MQTPRDWLLSTQSNISQAVASQRSALRQSHVSRKAHEETVSESLASYEQLHGSIEHKVKTTHRLVDQLQKQAVSLGSTIESTKQSLQLVDAAFKAKEPPLKLCRWRIQEREKRPIREQVRDAVTVALEHEEDALVSSQKHLQEASKRTKDVIRHSEEQLGDIMYDLGHKHQALDIDETCLRSTQRSWQAASEASRPGSPSLSVRPSRSGSVPGVRRRSAGPRGRHGPGGDYSPPRRALNESKRNEVTRQKDAGRLRVLIQQTEDKAHRLREDNARAVSRIERATMEAHKMVEIALQARIRDHRDMRRQLQSEIGESKDTISSTQTTIAATRSQMHALKEPKDLASSCTSWRKERAVREHIVDPVSTHLDQHQRSVAKNCRSLQTHQDSEREALTVLLERKAKLKADLSDKMTALQIDLTCLTEEAQHWRGSGQVR